MITVAQLIAAGAGPTQARAFADPLSAACALYGVDNDRRRAAFLAQGMHETQGLVHLEENLYYSNPARIQEIFRSHVHGIEDCTHLAKNPQALGSRVYANRMGNGDEASGDGWTFRGAGLLMLTGRGMHTAAAAALGQPLETVSAWMRDVEGACLSAAWYWARDPRLNALADAGDIDSISKLINVGNLSAPASAVVGLAERREAYRIALAALTDSTRMASA